MLLEDRRGFIDLEVLTSLGFIVLAGLAIGATVLGYIWSKNQGWEAMPSWQLIVIILVELIASYFFASRG